MLSKELEKFNKDDLRWIYKKLNLKFYENKNKKQLINILMEPLNISYKMETTDNFISTLTIDKIVKNLDKMPIELNKAPKVKNNSEWQYMSDEERIKSGRETERRRRELNTKKIEDIKHMENKKKSREIRQNMINKLNVANEKSYKDSSIKGLRIYDENVSNILKQNISNKPKMSRSRSLEEDEQEIYEKIDTIINRIGMCIHNCKCDDNINLSNIVNILSKQILVLHSYYIRLQTSSLYSDQTNIVDQSFKEISNLYKTLGINYYVTDEISNKEIEKHRNIYQISYIENKDIKMYHIILYTINLINEKCSCEHDRHCKIYKILDEFRNVIIQLKIYNNDLLKLK